MKIVVLKGGISAEREVSLRSGAAVAKALREKGYEAEELDVVSEEFVLPVCDVVFIALHGTFGEDGQVQAILDKQNLIYTGCGQAASEKAFDKVVSKEIFVDHEVPTPAFEICKKGERPSLALPFVVKPSRQGSSVGISRVVSQEQVDSALTLAFQYDDEVIVEQMIVGKELTVGVLGDQALPVVHIEPQEGFYDYQNKYTAGRTWYHCPADLSKLVTEAVQEAALSAHQALGCEVYSRVDVLLDAQERPWVLEANTIPGMTETSLLPKAAAAAGIGFGDLCERIVFLSQAMRKKNNVIL
ncbi:MAG: D-alanine--D-alanine ligase [Verrucomicrobiae bacterium]|nr:D-alanine--D-alanine ligase [Verrucomicrobiae bacterium]